MRGFVAAYIREYSQLTTNFLVEIDTPNSINMI